MQGDRDSSHPVDARRPRDGTDNSVLASLSNALQAVRAAEARVSVAASGLQPAAASQQRAATAELLRPLQVRAGANLSAQGSTCMSGGRET